MFLSQLLLLLSVCPICWTDNPLVETSSKWTMVEVKTTCRSATCPKKEHVWKSQPEMPGTKMPSGNFLPCFSILLSGNSASKVLHMFKHIGLYCISLRSYLRHQRVSFLFVHIGLFPVIQYFQLYNCGRQEEHAILIPLLLLETHARQLCILADLIFAKFLSLPLRIHGCKERHFLMRIMSNLDLGSREAHV